MHDTGTATETFILCELAGAAYAIPSRLVQHVEMVEQITPVPNAPACVEGVVFSRGQVIPALNLRQRFGFEKQPHDLRTRLIVIQALGRTVGLIVDTAREFLAIPPDAFRPPPAGIGNLSGDYLEGIATVGERLILLLNVDQVLAVADGVASLQVAQ